MDILKYGADCVVVGPPALRERVAAEIERARALYRGRRLKAAEAQ
jgi:predicted DNA-binding transcriptional regulator YafY